MNTLTNEELQVIKARCDAATPGPWANTDDVQEIFGHLPFDWWKVYAKKNENSAVPSKVICSMSPRATEEEISQARKISCENEAKTYDPGQAGVDARFISHARTDIPALLEYIYYQQRVHQWLRKRERLAAVLFEVANAADTVIHYFAGAHFNESDFVKMLDAMEPLRLALIAAGFGIPQENTSPISESQEPRP